MNLPIQAKAALVTLSVVGSGIAAGFILSFFPNWVIVAAFLIVALYIVYRAALSSLELDAAIDRMNNKTD